MWMILAIFIGSFVLISVAGVSVAWAIQAKAELEAWKKKHRWLVEAENKRAWHANRQMIVY